MRRVEARLGSQRLAGAMAAARSDMAEPEGLLPGEAAAAAAEEEEEAAAAAAAAGVGSSSSPPSSAAETESLLLLNGEAESMSEPSPESASQAINGNSTGINRMLK